MKKSKSHKDRKRLKEFKIALVAGSMSTSNKVYYAEDEEDCKELFIENNPDLDETDFWMEEMKSK